jgi:radical SAM protein with 4Fe4S-binding SPASM domain
MNPRDDVLLDRTTFARMRRIMPTFLAARRSQPEPLRVRPLPEELGFKLTNQCNLRCRHCYQWSDDGHHHDLDLRGQREHLPFRVVSEVFEATRHLESNVYLWGGEPLMYRHWDEVVELLAHDPRWTTICTNGFFIDQRLESLIGISPRLEMDVAVDGLEEGHDSLRGHGAFARTLRGVEALIDSRRRGEYRGEISVNCVITDAIAHHVSDIVEFWEDVGVDAIYLGLLWHLSDRASSAMDRYVENNRPWGRTEPVPHATRPSWHAYSYRMSPDLVEPLRAQLDRINRRSWSIKVRYNPAIEPGQLEEFITGSEHPAAGRTHCLAILSRMDVLPNGDVVSCKFFPESTVGNLLDDATETIWHGPRFSRLRETISRCGLMPVCAKCSLLYSRGA